MPEDFQGYKYEDTCSMNPRNEPRSGDGWFTCKEMVTSELLKISKTQVRGMHMGGRLLVTVLDTELWTWIPPL